jgi:hypothetical protein
MLDVETLTAERRRSFVETKGGVYFPIGGAIFWFLREAARLEKDSRSVSPDAATELVRPAAL